MATLLRIASPALVLTLDGPPRTGLNLDTAAAFDAVSRTSGGGRVDLEVSMRKNDETASWRPGGRSGVLVQEQTNYTLTVEDLSGLPVLLTTRDARQFTKVRSPGTAAHIKSGEINFKSTVGLFTFEVSNGVEEWSVTWEVFPTKIDYRSDYDALLHDVNDRVRALALANFRSTHRLGRARTDYSPSTTAEWLALLRHHVSELENGLRRINQQPHRTLIRRNQLTRAERIAKVNPGLIRQIARGQGAGGWTTAPGGPATREKLWDAAPVETVDNRENQNIKRQLIRLVQRLGQSIRQAKPAVASNPHHVELAALRDTVTGYLDRAPFDQVSDAPWQLGASLALLQKPGYRETTRTIRRLFDLIELDRGDIEVSIKDIDALYELWTFLHVTEVAQTALQNPVVQQHFDLKDDASVGVGIGYGSYVILSGENRQVTITYNKTIKAANGSNRPDVLLRIDTPDSPHLDIVIDAKYRVHYEPSYLKTWGAPGPPREALDACHRYRDAIIDPVTNKRHVVRAIAAFPLSPAVHPTVSSHEMVKAVDSVGVGALPLLPGSSGLFDTWLTDVLTRPVSDLAKNTHPSVASAHPPPTAVESTGGFE